MELKFSFFILTLITFCHGANVYCNFGPPGPESEFPPCQFYNITPVTKANENITIVGQPENYVDNTPTSFGFDSSSVLIFIPTQLFKIFPKMTHFSAFGSFVTTLRENSFNYCSNLNWIQLYENSISNIPARFASTCYAVEYLTLSNNKIRTINKNAFEGLESLRYLMISDNEISCLPPNLLRGSIGLFYFGASNNQIKALHPALFKDLTQLENVNLSSNNISYIPNFDFRRTGTTIMGTMFITLDDNPIIAIDPNFLTTLYYSRNSFNSMGPMTLSLDQSDMDATTCINPNSGINFFMLNLNWVQTHVGLKYRTSCYTNWNEEMANNTLAYC